jgi:hypothetical protein
VYSAEDVYISRCNSGTVHIFADAGYVKRYHCSRWRPFTIAGSTELFEVNERTHDLCMFSLLCLQSLVADSEGCSNLCFMVTSKSNASCKCYSQWLCCGVLFAKILHVDGITDSAREGMFIVTVAASCMACCCG